MNGDPATPPRASTGGWHLVLGLGILALSVVLSLLSFDPSFEYGQGYKERPLPLVVGLLGGQSLLYVIAVLLAFRRPPALAWVLGIGLASRIVLVVSAPIQETDFYRYIWDGKVVTRGLDPYLFSPLEVQRYPVTEPEGPAARTLETRLEMREQLARRVSLEKASESNERILDRVNHPHYSTIYPPLLELVFGVHGWLVPDDASVHLQIVAMKALFVSFDLGSWLLVVLLLRRCGRASGLSLVYAWCPLVLKEIANSGHVDSLPALLVAWSVLLAVGRRDEGGAISLRRGALAGSLLGLAVAAKIYAIVLLPILARRAGLRGAIALSASLLLVLLVSEQLYPEGANSRRETMTVFALFWENHCGIFWWLERWIARLDPGLIELEIGGAGLAIERSRIIARCVVAVALGVVVLVLSWRTRVSSTADEVLRRAFVALAGLFLLGPIGFPWYFVWCVTFLPFARSRAWILLPGLLVVYYLSFWYDYHDDDKGLERFDHVVVSMEYASFYAVLGLEMAARWRRAGRGGRRLT